MSRVVRHSFAAPPGNEAVDEAPLERVLERAKAARVVTVYDAGRGRVVWFEGRPAKALRKVRDQIKAMLPKDWT